MTLLENVKCPECGGEMEFDGVVITTIPPIVPLTCSKCGAKRTLREIQNDGPDYRLA